MDFRDVVELVAKTLDAVGVVVLVAGIVLATVPFLRSFVHKPGDLAYRAYRRGIGRAILLSLEFLVAADIIRTVAVRPTLDNVVVLAIIVLIRTFLSLALELELEGRWPWQRTIKA